MDSLVELFVAVDDFWQIFRPAWHEHLLASGKRQRIRSSRLSESEIMTIVILFHQSLLHRLRRSPSQARLSASGKLSTLRDAHAVDGAAVIRVSAHQHGPLHGDFVRG